MKYISGFSDKLFYPAEVKIYKNRPLKNVLLSGIFLLDFKYVNVLANNEGFLWYHGTAIIFKISVKRFLQVKKATF